MIILTEREKEFIEKARDATIISLGLGSIITERPRVEIVGGMVIEYDDPERAAAVWKLAIEQKLDEEGDF